MNPNRCTYRYPDGARCSSWPLEHVHRLPADCGNPARHHDFVPEPPHKHRYDRCECGARREARVSA